MLFIYFDKDLNSGNALLYSVGNITWIKHFGRQFEYIDNIQMTNPKYLQMDKYIRIFKHHCLAT
jgi:hypothetical protein